MTWLLLTLAVLLVWTPAWRIVSWWLVFVHELGHALVALVFGGGVRAIKLHRDGSGHTEWTAAAPDSIRTWLRFQLVRFLVLQAGYLAGGMSAVLLALAARHGSTSRTIALWSCTACVALAVLLSRNWRAFTISVAAVLSCAGVLVTPGIGEHALLFVAFVNAMSGLRDAVLLHRMPVRRGDDSDPGQLAGMTRLPARAWTAFFLGANAALVATTVTLAVR